MKNKLLKFIDKLNCSRSIVMSDQTITFCYTFPVKEYQQGLSDTLEFFLDLLTPTHTFVNSASEYNENGDLFFNNNTDIVNQIIEERQEQIDKVDIIVEFMSNYFEEKNKMMKRLGV